MGEGGAVELEAQHRELRGTQKAFRGTKMYHRMDLVDPIQLRASSELFDYKKKERRFSDRSKSRDQVLSIGRVCVFALSIALQMSSFAVFTNFDRNFVLHLNISSNYTLDTLIATPSIGT